MKILVFSDSHGNTNLIRKAIEAHKDSTDLIIHLGDKVTDSRIFSELCPHIANINIFGNCDYFSSGVEAYDEKLLQLGNTRIKAFLCHGHDYSVKSRTDILTVKAKMCGAKIALYGHSHIASISESEGILLMNPGSVSQPRGTEPASYGVIQIEDNEIMPSIIFDR